MSKYGICPDSKKDISGKMKIALEKIRKRSEGNQDVILCFEKGVYDFYPSKQLKEPIISQITIRIIPRK